MAGPTTHEVIRPTPPLPRSYLLVSHTALSALPPPPPLSQRFGGGARGRRRRLGRMARPGRGALPLPDLEGEQASNIMKIYLSLA